MATWICRRLRPPRRSLNEKITPVLANTDSEQNYFRRGSGRCASALVSQAARNSGVAVSSRVRNFFVSSRLVDGTTESSALANWRRRRASIVRRIRQVISRRDTSAPVNTGARFGRKSSRTRTGGGCAGIHTAELERSTRYSADASHQLKLPRHPSHRFSNHCWAREGFEISRSTRYCSTLLHQTRRLTGVIEVFAFAVADGCGPASNRIVAREI